MDLQMIKFRFHENDTGSLTFLESSRDIPFDIKRIYYIHHVKDNARRGFHAHKDLKQVLICISGSCSLLLDDGTEKANLRLSNPSEGLLIDAPIWREMYDFSPGAVLLVLASDYYDEDDYIRNYQTFLEYVQGD